MARHTTSTARNATFGLMAAAMLAATSIASPARSDEPGKRAAPTTKKIPAECAAKLTEEARLRCGIEYYEGEIGKAEARIADANARSAAAKARSADAKARSADAKARSADAKTRGAEADKEGVCLGLIMKDLESNGTKTASLAEPPSKGQACNLAKSLKLVAG